MLKDKYYTLPIRFSDLIDQKGHSTCDLKSSVAQYIHLITTTYLGEYRIDPDFGCSIWEYDFDNTMTDNRLKEGLKRSLIHALERYEKRLHNLEISINITQAELLHIANSKRVKKRIEVQIKAILIHTNEPFSYFEYFFLGPLSYY
jgi:phage baseplate assembly protein W